MGLIISRKMAKTIRLLDLKLDMLYPQVLKKKLSMKIVLQTLMERNELIAVKWPKF